VVSIPTWKLKQDLINVIKINYSCESLEILLNMQVFILWILGWRENARREKKKLVLERFHELEKDVCNFKFSIP
jgi:hypothetical protein